MLRCALDGRRGSVRLVLVTCNAPPEILEARCFPRTVKPRRVLSCLAAWKEEYRTAPDRLVCCREDPLPDGLVEALEAAGHGIEWLKGGDVDAVMAVWRRIRPDPRWDRGGLMAALVEASLEPTPSSRAAFTTALAQDWLYTWLMQQVADLREWREVFDARCAAASGDESPCEVPF